MSTAGILNGIALTEAPPTATRRYKKIAEGEEVKGTRLVENKQGVEKRENNRGGQDAKKRKERNKVEQKQAVLRRLLKNKKREGITARQSTQAKGDSAIREKARRTLRGRNENKQELGRKCERFSSYGASIKKGAPKPGLVKEKDREEVRSQKPRWTHWEGECLKIALEQEIPLKIIAFVLQKSLTSVSKKIRKLGLRPLGLRRGRLKGLSYGCKGQRVFQEIRKMINLVRTYAPPSSLLKKEEEEKLAPSYRDKLSQQNCPYSLAYGLPYTFLEEKEVSFPGIEQAYDHSLYIPFCYVEKWALLKGFHRVQANLRAHGIWYWKQGKYFSQAQVLLQLNGIRLSKKLEPLHLYEEEAEG